MKIKRISYTTRIINVIASFFSLSFSLSMKYSALHYGTHPSIHRQNQMGPGDIVCHQLAKELDIPTVIRSSSSQLRSIKSKWGLLWKMAIFASQYSYKNLTHKHNRIRTIHAHTRKKKFHPHAYRIDSMKVTPSDPLDLRLCAAKNIIRPTRDPKRLETETQRRVATQTTFPIYTCNGI